MLTRALSLTMAAAGIAALTAAVGVDYYAFVVNTSSNHTGMALGLLSFCVRTSALASAGLVLWAKRRPASLWFALAAFAVAALDLWVLEHQNVMTEHDVWIAKGMPDRS